MNDNQHSEAVALAASQIDMNQPDNSERVPKDNREKPETDLSQLTYPQRLQHHTTALAAAYHAGGKPAVAAYKLRHPEAARCWIKPTVKVGTQKPDGYCNAVGKLLGAWLTEPWAVNRTNQADVAFLNAELGAHKRPDNDISRPMNKATRERCERVFADRGLTLPAQANTLSDVKAAAKAALAGALPQARPFGNVGTIADNVLTIGTKAFKIVPRHGHDYVRLYSQGTETLFRLDRLADFIEQAGLQAGQPEELPIHSIVDRGKNRNEPPQSDKLPVNSGTDAATIVNASDDSPMFPGNTGTGVVQASPSLSERIAALAAATRREPPAAPPSRP